MTVRPIITGVAQGIGLSSQGSIHNYIQALVNEGLIMPSEIRSRGLRLANYDHVILPADRSSIQGVVVGQLCTYP